MNDAATPVPIGPAHAEAAAALHALCFAEPWDGAAMAAVLGMPGAFGRMALADGVPVGLIVCRVAADEAEVLTVAVAPAWRRSGLGRALVAAAAVAAAADGAAALFLEVAVDNAAARALYRATGFAAAGHRRGYYRDPAGNMPRDAAILRLDLTYGK